MNTQNEQNLPTNIQGTDSSFKIITSVANTMIGSSMIIFPILFIKDGLFSSLIAMCIVCVVQYATCRLLVLHNRPDQMNFNKSILRILGYKWWLFNSWVNISLLFFVCIGYYLLIVENFYMVTSSLIKQDWYSQKYASAITILICMPMIFMKEIDSLLKFFKYTIYCVIAFGLFIAVTVIKQIAEGNVDYSKYQFFDPDFSNVAGTFALSFLIHPVAAPILKKNVNQNNNKRDLLFGYILTAFIYFFVGFIGSMSCAQFIQAINIDTENNFTTVFSCFDKHQTTTDDIFFVLGKIVQTGVLIQNLSVMPILHFLTRKELLDLVPEQNKKKKVFWIESCVFLVAALGIAILQINVSIVLSFDGAIIGFFMAYGIPIYMHLKCYHFKPSAQEKQEIKKSLLMSESEDTLSSLQNQQNVLACNQHPPRQKNKHLLIYGTVMVIGFALAVFKLVSFFHQSKKD